MWTLPCLLANLVSISFTCSPCIRQSPLGKWVAGIMLGNLLSTAPQRHSLLHFMSKICDSLPLNTGMASLALVPRVLKTSFLPAIFSFVNTTCILGSTVFGGACGLFFQSLYVPLSYTLPHTLHLSRHHIFDTRHSRL